MNLKKLFASTMIVALLATMLPSTFAATYSQEVRNAYDYAYAKQITTMPTIEESTPYGVTYRNHMSKMISNWAQDVLNTEANEDAKCVFIDTYNESTEMKKFITLSCQLGLMGQGITQFRPTDVVSRAEFGTTLSRALWGDTYNGGNPYYEAHLNALKDAGIMTDLSNPMRDVLRYEVWLMLMRADDDYESSTTSCTAQEVLACLSSDDVEACFAECSDATIDPTDPVEPDEIERSGDLTAEEGDMPSNGSSVPRIGMASFGELVLESSEKVEVYSIELERSGLGNRSDINRVWFELDGVRVSGRAAVQSDGKVTVSFSPALEVRSSETLELIVDMNAATAGGEHKFTLTDMVTSAEDVDFDFETPMVRTADYTVASVTMTASGSPITHKGSDSDLELGRFTLLNNSNDEIDVEFKAITFRQNGTADLENLSDIALYLNGKEISKDYVTDGKNVSFKVNSQVLQAGTTYTFYLRGNIGTVDNANGDTYQFTLRNAEDANIVEATTQFRTTVNNGVDLVTYTVQGWDVMFTKDTSISSRTITPGAIEEEVLAGTIKVKEAITLEDLVNNFKVTTQGVDVKDVVSKLRLVIGRNSATWTPANVAGSTQDVEFDWTFTITKDSDVKVYVDVKSNFNQNATISVSSLSANNFAVIEYVNSQNAVNWAVGTIAGVQLTVAPAKVFLTRTDGLSTRNVVAGSYDTLVFEGEYSNSTSTKVTVSAIEMAGSLSEAAFNDKVTATLFVDGSAVKTQNYRSLLASFAGLNIDVEKGNNVKIRIEANLDSSIATGSTETFVIKTVTATDENSQNVTVTDVTAATIEISGEGSIDASESTSNSSAQLVASSTSDVVLAKINLSAKDDDLKLTHLYLENAAATGADLATRFNSFVITIDGKKVNGNVANGMVEFDASSANIVIPAGEEVTATVTANTNAVLNATSLSGANMVEMALVTWFDAATQMAGTVDGLRLVSNTNGNLVETVTVTNPVVGPVHQLVRANVTVAKSSFTSSLTDVLKVNVTANWNKAGVNSLTLNVNASNVTPTDIVIYKNGTISSANEVARVAYADGLKTIPFNTGTVVDIAKGSTTSFLVTFDGNTIGADTPYYEISLRDLSYVDYFNDGTMNVTTVAAFDNVGTPVTNTYRG